MKINDCNLTLGEIIEDFMSLKNLKRRDFSKLMKEYGGSLSEKQIGTWKNDNPPKSMTPFNLIALSQITKIPIDDLLNNHLEEKNHDTIFWKELGLKSSTTLMLKKYKNPSKKPLFEAPKKSIDSISELDIINYFISDEDLNSTFKEQIKNFIIGYKKLEKDYNNLNKNKQYFTKEDFQKQKKNLKTEENDLQKKLFNEIDRKMHTTINKFIKKQLSLFK